MWDRLMTYLRAKINSRRGAPGPPPPDDTGELLLEAEAARRAAERKLEQTRMAGREVRIVSIQAQRLRAENNFSARWDAAIRRPRGG